MHPRPAHNPMLLPVATTAASVGSAWRVCRPRLVQTTAIGLLDTGASSLHWLGMQWLHPRYVPFAKTRQQAHVCCTDSGQLCRAPLCAMATPGLAGNQAAAKPHHQNKSTQLPLTSQPSVHQGNAGVNNRMQTVAAAWLPPLLLCTCIRPVSRPPPPKRSSTMG